MLKRFNQQGDTIVEVLIAMAVIALILGGSYATASRSLQIGRRAQERMEALKLVEGQIEQMKYLAKLADPAKNIFDASQNTFCIEGNNKIPITDFADIANYDPRCKLNDLYSYGVQYQAADNLFVVQAKWDRLGGGGIDEVVIRYRLHP